MSKTHPPHLPPKSCSIRQRTTLQTLPWLIVFAVFAAVVSTAVSLSFLAWYVPDFVSYQVPVTSLSRPTSGSTGQIDPLLARSIEERSVTLYRQSVSPESGVLRSDAFVGHALVLSSDGWIAFLPPDGITLQSLVALDADGQIHRFESRRIDETTGIVYAKLSDGNYLVSSIDSWQDVHEGTGVWVHGQDGWKYTYLEDRLLAQDTGNITLSSPLYAYPVDAPDGTPVYRDNGSFVGFVEDGTIVEGWYVGVALRAVLAKEAFYVPNTQYRGALVQAYIDPHSGVYVDAPAMEVLDVPPVVTSVTSSLQIGDIITAYGTNAVDPEDMARLFAERSQHTLTVVRKDTYTSIVIER